MKRIAESVGFTALVIAVKKKNGPSHKIKKSSKVSVPLPFLLIIAHFAKAV
jgi:hypothetical protein